jgi:TP53 regulating kinase-like protein
MPRMLDVDTKAERIVKEYIAGETVYTLVLKDALPVTFAHCQGGWKRV